MLPAAAAGVALPSAAVLPLSRSMSVFGMLRIFSRRAASASAVTSLETWSA